MSGKIKGGLMGKILRLDLTNRKVLTIDTADYEEWVGGQAMATAIWFDLVKDKAVGAYDPENTLVVMTGPTAGTLAPGGGRLEMVGIAPQAYPREQFTRTGMGGRFSAMLKFAGWDGIVIEGSSDTPVWIDIRNGDVQIKDADYLWGLDTFETQEDIWREVASDNDYGEWMQVGGTRRDEGRTTQRSAVMAIGPAGENKKRVGVIIHDAGNAFGNGGFGGVWGAKNLKAISVIGTGSVPVARPKELLETRKWLMQFNADLEKGEARSLSKYLPDTIQLGAMPAGGVLGYGETIMEHWWSEFGRPLGCYGCTLHCRMNVKSGSIPGGESQCVEAIFYNVEDLVKHGKTTEASYVATQLLETLGINGYQGGTLAISYIKALHKMEKDTGKKILPDNDLPWDEIGSEHFARVFLEDMTYGRTQLGKDLGEGIARAAAKWGRLEEDMTTGLLNQAYWGYNIHWGGNDELDWAYESMMRVRDINMHDLNKVQYNGTGGAPPYPANWLPERVVELCPWWEDGQWKYGDEHIGELGDDNIYSESMARTIQWHGAYWTFWKNSTTYCDWYVPSWFNTAGETENGVPKGVSPELETRFFSAITGWDLSYEEGLEIGRRSWNMERAILGLQGRHRKEEWLPPYPPYDKSCYYTKPMGGREVIVYEDGEFKWKKVIRPLDAKKFDDFKTLYYQQEGWDTNTGLPTRKTLEDAGLKKVADELEEKGII